MLVSNVRLGKNVDIDPSTSINNVVIGDNVKIAKRCSIYGSKENLLEIGMNSYIGMNSILNGFNGRLEIGAYVSVAQNVNIMCDSGPNASLKMQRIFPIEQGPVKIGDHCWIGANTVVMPNVIIEEYCVIAANSFVNRSFPRFSIIGGSPARLLRELAKEEIEKLLKE